MGIFSELFSKKIQPLELRVVDSQNLLQLINRASKGGKVVAVSPRSAVNISVVFECIDVITRTLSLVSPKIYEAREKTKIVAYKNPLYSLINRQPYNLYDAGTFYRRIVTNYLLFGNAYVEIIRTGSRVTGLRLHEPDYVDVEIVEMPDGTEEHVYKVYRMHSKDNNRIVLQKDMIHIMDYNLDGVKGLSRINLKKNTLTNAGNVYNYTTQMYENGANLSGIIYGDRLIDKQALDYFKQKFEERASYKNGGIEALPPGFKYEPLKYNLPFADAQIIESNKFTVEDVARIFGVPLSLIGRGDSADNKADREFNTFLTTTIAPLCLLIENEFNRKLFPDNPDTYVKFELKGLYRVDMITRYQSYQIAVNGGWMNKDEVRYFEDMNPIPGGLGETYYQQLNTIPLDKAQAYFDSIINNSKAKETNNDNTGI